MNKNSKNDIINAIYAYIVLRGEIIMYNVSNYFEQLQNYDYIDMFGCLFNTEFKNYFYEFGTGKVIESYDGFYFFQRYLDSMSCQ